MCECQSYNRPDVTGKVAPVVRPYRKHFPHSAKEFVSLDACIADAIEALWEVGIETNHSCCSHNGQFFPMPSVGLWFPADVCRAAEILSQHGPSWRIFVDVMPDHPTNREPTDER